MPSKKRVTIIGLTGNIASGKSTVLGQFEAKGCKVISTDKIVHELIEKDAWVRNKITSAFGDDILVRNPNTLRTKLADIVFEDENKRKVLEQILHPEVENVLRHEINLVPDKTVVVIEIPLLFEARWDYKLDHTVLVDCPLEVRRERFYAKKGALPGDFERREKVQWSQDKKAELAEFIIDNSGDLAYTESQIQNILSSI